MLSNSTGLSEYGLDLYSYLTFTDRVGVVGEIGNKAISAFNSVEVEVEAELGNRMLNLSPHNTLGVVRWSTYFKVLLTYQAV